MNCLLTNWKRVIVVVAFMFIAMLLASCRPVMGPSWLLVVSNQPLSVDSAFTVEVCSGRSSASMVVGRSVNMSVSATPEEGRVEERTRHEGAVAIGAHVSFCSLDGKDVVIND